MNNKVNGIKNGVKMPPATAKDLHPQNSPIRAPQGQSTAGNESIKKSEANAKKIIIKNATYSAAAIAAAGRQRGM